MASQEDISLQQIGEILETERQKYIGSQATQYEQFTSTYKKIIQMLGAKIKEQEQKIQELESGSKTTTPKTQPNRKQRRAAARKQQEKKE